MLQEGAKAPDFTLQSDEGKPISLSDFKGKKLVVYFYPKDNTPGCTTEACGFRDVYDDILEKGTVVIGISADSVEKHGKFKSKYNLPFHLVSDPEKQTIQAFGAWGTRKMYGKKYGGIIRSTFVIDEDGVVLKAFPKVKVATHAADILAVL